MFWPLLIPETIRSGICSSSPVSAICTQSLGVPLMNVNPFSAWLIVSGRLQRQRVARAAAVLLRRDDGDLTERAHRVGQRSEPGAK